MSDAIYVVGADGAVTPVPRTPYALEDDLQKLVADHPELLPGEQISPEAPRRWQLIRREAAVGSATEASRWSLDHLFVDQDAVPTLVEAKRGGNPEARREVVAQLLEYAANGTLYWPIDQLRSWFEEAHGGLVGASNSIAALLRAEAPSEEAYEAFWERFEGNLRDRRIRLIFVADAIPEELKTLVEFLNEQMSRVEVYAVEVVQYSDGARQLLKPQLVGQTATARARKATTVRGSDRPTPWTESELVDLLAAESGSAGQLGQEILNWAHRRSDLAIAGNRGLTYPMLSFKLRMNNGRAVTVCSLYGLPQNLLEIPLRNIAHRPPFTDPAEMAALHSALKPITRMAKGDPLEESYAYGDAEHLAQGASLTQLLAIMDTCIDRIKAADHRA